MKQQSSLVRLWSYLKAYRFSVFFAVFLKIVSVIMSVIEPFVLGLAITELTSNLLAMANGLCLTLTSTNLEICWDVLLVM